MVSFSFFLNGELYEGFGPYILTRLFNSPFDLSRSSIRVKKGIVYQCFMRYLEFLQWRQETPEWRFLGSPHIYWSPLMNQWLLYLEQASKDAFGVNVFIEADEEYTEFSADGLFEIKFKDNWTSLLHWGTIVYTL